MPTIYLMHPIHGRKVAIAEIEAVYDESKGWKRYEVGALLTPQKVDNALTPAPNSAALDVPIKDTEPEDVLQRRRGQRKEQV